MQQFNIPDLRIAHGWKAPEISPSRQKINLSCDDKIRLRDNGVTLDVVAQKLGVSRERARQLEAQALKKCRRWCNARGYRLEDLVRRI